LDEGQWQVKYLKRSLFEKVFLDSKEPEALGFEKGVHDYWQRSNVLDYYFESKIRSVQVLFYYADMSSASVRLKLA
jgi:hypothetical protein